MRCKCRFHLNRGRWSLIWDQFNMKSPKWFFRMKSVRETRSIQIPIKAWVNDGTLAYLRGRSKIRGPMAEKYARNFRLCDGRLHTTNRPQILDQRVFEKKSNTNYLTVSFHSHTGRGCQHRYLPFQPTELSTPSKSFSNASQTSLHIARDDANELSIKILRVLRR